MALQKFNINRVKVFGFRWDLLNNQRTVERLKFSIEETKLWRLPGRLITENGYDVEIPFGWHRLEAAKTAGLKEIWIDVREMSDYQMMNLAHHENSPGYHDHDPIEWMKFNILNWRTVITNAFRECDTFEDFSEKHSDIVSKLGLNEHGFQTIKGQMNIPGYQGVGIRVLQEFLKAEWKPREVRKVIEESMAKKKFFDPDIYEEEQTKIAEAEKKAKELFEGDDEEWIKRHEEKIMKACLQELEDTPETEEMAVCEGVCETIDKTVTENTGSPFFEDLGEFIESCKEPGYTHKPPKEDTRADNALKARAEKKRKEIEMTEDMKRIIANIFKRLERTEFHIKQEKEGILVAMLKLMEIKNAWNMMDKIPNLKAAFEMRIDRLKTQVKKIMKLYVMLKTNSYKVNMTMGDLEKIIKQGEGK